MERELMKAWGASVAERRRLMGITQVRLADLAGTSQTTISRVEHGEAEPGAVLQMRIAAALRIGTRHLFPVQDLDPVDLSGEVA